MAQLSGRAFNGVALKTGGVKFSMKTLQHVGHARAKRASNGVALKNGTGGLQNALYRRRFGNVRR